MSNFLHLSLNCSAISIMARVGVRAMLGCFVSPATPLVDFCPGAAGLAIQTNACRTRGLFRKSMRIRATSSGASSCRK